MVGYKHREKTDEHCGVTFTERKIKDEERADFCFLHRQTDERKEE